MGAKVSEKSFTDDRKETLGQSLVQPRLRIVELELERLISCDRCWFCQRGVGPSHARRKVGQKILIGVLHFFSAFVLFSKKYPFVTVSW